MKLQYKTLTSALIALGLSGSAFAAVANDQYADFSQQEPTWSFGFDYLLVQPVSNGLDFASLNLTNTDLDIDQIAFDLGSLDTKLNTSGIRLEGAYELGDGRDVNLNWTHLFGKNLSETFELESQVDDEAVTDNDTLSASGKYKFDAVNVELGQTIVTGERSNVRIFAGAQFARIGTELATTFNSFEVNNTDPQDPVVTPTNEPTIDHESSLFAIGPRLGVTGSYQIVDNVSFVGSAATSLLVGNLKTRNNLDLNNVVEVSKRVVVPAFEAKLGLRYDYEVANDGTVSAELGYQTASYINAIKSQTGALENFAFQGAYLSLKWTGDLA